MRKIILRCKRLDNGEWVFGNYNFEGDLVSIEALAIDGEKPPIFELIFQGSESVTTDRVDGNMIINLEIAITDDKAAKVVGNIFDNPNLLKGSEK